MVSLGATLSAQVFPPRTEEVMDRLDGLRDLLFESFGVFSIAHFLFHFAKTSKGETKTQFGLQKSQ